MKRLLSLTAACLLIVGCAESAEPELSGDQLVEGVYSTPREIQLFSGTTLELKDGKYRYWFYTDVVSHDHPEPAWPLTGKYEFQDGKLLLQGDDDVNQREWYCDVLKGTPVLWRGDAHYKWQTKQDIFPYGILIWTPQEMPAEGVEGLKRPEVIPFYTEEQQKKIRETMGPLLEQPE